MPQEGPFGGRKRFESRTRTVWQREAHGWSKGHTTASRCHCAVGGHEHSGLRRRRGAEAQHATPVEQTCDECSLRQGSRLHLHLCLSASIWKHPGRSFRRVRHRRVGWTFLVPRSSRRDHGSVPFLPSALNNHVANRTPSSDPVLVPVPGVMSLYNGQELVDFKATSSAEHC